MVTEDTHKKIADKNVLYIYQLNLDKSLLDFF